MKNEEKKDISRTPVILLAILTVVFSVLGTLAVMTEANRVASQVEESPQATGEVRIFIVGDTETIRTAASEGNININIARNTAIQGIENGDFQ